MVASSIAQGLSVPSFTTIAAYHPQAALAIASGVPVRPSIRPLSVTFDSTAFVGQQKPASFAEIISSYSIFAGADITIDPSNAFEGNVLKYVNDQAQMEAETGITMTLEVRGLGSDYNPVPEPTPLQSVGRLFSAAVGIWTLDNPDNVKALFTLNTPPNAAPESTAFPITVWFNFGFLVLGEGAGNFMCMAPADARKMLREQFGIGGM
jgi:hypothetical protein